MEACRRDRRRQLSLAFVFFLTITGMVVLVISAAAIVSIGIGKFRQWWRGDNGTAVNNMVAWAEQTRRERLHLD